MLSKYFLIFLQVYYTKRKDHAKNEDFFHERIFYNDLNIAQHRLNHYYNYMQL
jgi:hypothetical protein